MLEKFQSICGKILRNIPRNYTWLWEWDDMLNTTLVVFDTQHADFVLEVMRSVFEQEWDFFSFHDPDESVQAYFTEILGIVPGQTLFTTRIPPAILFAAWWPWGNNKSVSLRIGIYSTDDTILNREEIENQLCQWFAI